MMKSAEDRSRGELAEPSDRPIGRRILAQGQMGSEFVVIAGVGRKDPAQVSFAKDDDVIRHSRRIEPISLPACPFCQGDRGAIGWSRIPMAARRFVTA